MVRFSPQRSLVSSLILAAALSACSGPTAQLRMAPPAQPFDAVAVCAVDLASGGTALDVAKRTEDVLTTLWKQSRWRVVGPQDFSVLRRRNRDFLHSTDLVVRARQLGIHAATMAVLRVSISRSEAHGEAVAQKGGHVSRGFDYQGEATIEADLWTIRGKLLATITVHKHLDPFAPHPDSDRRPQVRRAITQAVAAIVRACPDCVRTDARPDLGLHPAPSVLLGMADPAGHTWRQRLAGLDPLSRDQRLLQQMQYLQSDISAAAVERFAKMPPAVCVGADPGPPWRPGDCITAIDNHPCTSPHDVALAMSHHPGQALVLQVEHRDGTTQTLNYPSR